MNRPTRARVAFGVMLLTCTPAALADEASALQIRLRIEEGCAVEPALTRKPCAVAHQRSDEATPPPQVQALTPPAADAADAERPWRTLTF